MCIDVIPLDRPAEYSADRAHFPVDRGGLVAGLHPSCADQLQVSPGDRVQALGHDWVEVIAEGVLRLLVAFVMSLEPRHIGVVDEIAQRGQS